MSEKDEFDILRNAGVPAPGKQARDAALRSALGAFDENFSTAPQGSADAHRQSGRMNKLWSAMMQMKLSATPAVAGLLVLPIAGYATWQLMSDGTFGIDRDVAAEKPVVETTAPASGKSEQPQELAATQTEERERSFYDTLTQAEEAVQDLSGQVASSPRPAQPSRLLRSPAGGESKMMVLPPSPEPALELEENRDRFQSFETNPVRSALESPVSTFSIDVDTASYAFVRRSLKEGFLPQPDNVRVEEMINYFPYDWAGPEDASTPFNTTVTVMPSPWNEHTKLMHVAIKGYDVQPAEKPQSNLVFLIDTSGSMNAPDKLPLLKSAFRLLVNQLGADDTVSIVTYAGSAGTVLEPTSGSERSKILAALDNLDAGGRTAGEEGIREAYRLAEQSFVEGGVNRVMLATDGDFNVGQTSDEDLKTLIEDKRESGVFLSVFGFGRGNLNDQVMQTIAQNGNGTAAYIDTLAEAEKTLVEEAGSTLFPIAKDVKIQVEFNPQMVSEYRLIGYETRALNREDFNNDRVDAGEIGSGHSVTAIYEITPKGSPAEMIDDLRYGEERPAAPAGTAQDGEYAFLKLRYKAPDGDTSKLITTPVTAENEIASFDGASTDQRFSVAVAAFGQKLRKADATAGLSYDEIMRIATAARGSDPFGYRAEFLSMVRLASALGERR
ncbi:MAG: VWA domain-containing protein [Brucellaceae bacterium]|nr:VWA domain-containing protein [Brucellaceae bacterium]